LVFTVRTYATPAAYDPIVSAQISTLPTPTQQLTAVPNDADVIHDRSQVSNAELLPVLTTQHRRMSEIAWTKHRRVQLSMALAVVGVSLVAVAGLS
jgi:hypothetical protein